LTELQPTSTTHIDGDHGVLAAVKLAKVLERFRVFLREQYERRQVLSFHTFEITNETIVSLVSYVVCRRLTRSETILIDPDVVFLTTTVCNTKNIWIRCVEHYVPYASQISKMTGKKYLQYAHFGNLHISCISVNGEWFLRRILAFPPCFRVKAVDNRLRLDVYRTCTQLWTVERRGSPLVSVHDTAPGTFLSTVTQSSTSSSRIVTCSLVTLLFLLPFPRANSFMKDTLPALRLDTSPTSTTPHQVHPGRILLGVGGMCLGFVGGMFCTNYHHNTKSRQCYTSTLYSRN
jgi:hypothetical protein